MKLYMETTRIQPQKTAMEIQVLLSRLGATQIVHDLRDGELIGIRWTIEQGGVTIPFVVPVRTKEIFRHFQKRRHSGQRPSHRRDQDELQASRVAWRIALRWLQVQASLVEAGLSEITEVFMPYIEVRPGRSLFAEMRDSGFGPGLKALPSPEQEI